MSKRYFNRIILLAGCIAFALCMTACGAKTADEDAIKSDILGYREEEILDDGESLDEVTVTDRNTDKKSGVDRVICSIASHDSEKSYVKGATVVYALDEDDKEWVIENITVDSRNKWKITPNAAPTDDAIRDQLIGQSILDDDEEWIISDSNIADFVVKGHNTDLENLKDIVTVNVTVNDIVEKLNADLTLNLGFDDGWKLTGVENEENIAVDPISGKENIVDEDKLIGVITDEKLTFGSNNSKQEISADKAEISGFEITDTKESNKGIYQTYKCTFTLQKNYVDFKVDTSVEYDYESEAGWVCKISDQTMDVISVADITGTWTGESVTRYSNNDLVTMEIYKDSDGKLSGSYSYDEKTADYTGEYEVSGVFNEKTLELKLDAGAWIMEPKHHGPFEKDNVDLLLLVDSGKMKGSGHDGTSLTVSREE